MTPIDIPIRKIPRLPKPTTGFKWDYINNLHHYVAELLLQIGPDGSIDACDVMGITILTNRDDGGQELSKKTDERLWEWTTGMAWEDFSDDGDAQRRAERDYRTREF